jgi:hypothetical protein
MRRTLNPCLETGCRMSVALHTMLFQIMACSRHYSLRRQQLGSSSRTRATVSSETKTLSVRPRSTRLRLRNLLIAGLRYGRCGTSAAIVGAQRFTFQRTRRRQGLLLSAKARYCICEVIVLAAIRLRLSAAAALLQRHTIAGEHDAQPQG